MWPFKRKGFLNIDEAVEMTAKKLNISRAAARDKIKQASLTGELPVHDYKTGRRLGAWDLAKKKPEDIR